MKESRSYQINKRVFNKQDLTKIANLLYKRAELLTSEGEKLRTTYQLNFSGGVSYESDTPDIFLRDEILEIGRAHV